ncbi:hypothetical protein ACFXPS_22470 [Nocardia sp. NPDC059091]|uniref:hypothetical protein n=1 Tax=Nocardia sp. NPDC059091 TaxID=3346724 RepID=UPI0036AB2DD7
MSRFTAPGDASDNLSSKPKRDLAVNAEMRLPAALPWPSVSGGCHRTSRAGTSPPSKCTALGTNTASAPAARTIEEFRKQAGTTTQVSDLRLLSF